MRRNRKRRARDANLLGAGDFRHVGRQLAGEVDWQEQRDSEIRIIASVIAAEASKRPGVDHDKVLTVLLASTDFCAGWPWLYYIISDCNHPLRQRAIDRLADYALQLMAQLARREDA